MHAFEVNSDAASFELLSRSIRQIVEALLRDLLHDLPVFWHSHILAASRRQAKASDDDALENTPPSWMEERLRGVLCQYVLWKVLHYLTMHLTMPYLSPHSPHPNWEPHRASLSPAGSDRNRPIPHLATTLTHDLSPLEKEAKDDPRRSPPTTRPLQKPLHTSDAIAPSSSLFSYWSCEGAPSAAGLSVAFASLAARLQADLFRLHGSGWATHPPQRRKSSPASDSPHDDPPFLHEEEEHEHEEEEEEDVHQGCLTYAHGAAGLLASTTISRGSIPHWNGLLQRLRDSATKTSMGLDASLLAWCRVGNDEDGQGGSCRRGGRRTRKEGRGGTLFFGSMAETKGRQETIVACGGGGYRDGLNGIWRALLNDDVEEEDAFCSILFPSVEETPSRESGPVTIFGNDTESKPAKNEEEEEMIRSGRRHSSSFTYFRSLQDFLQAFFSSTHLHQCQREGANRLHVLAEWHAAFDSIVGGRMDTPSSRYGPSSFSSCEDTKEQKWKHTREKDMPFALHSARLPVTAQRRWERASGGMAEREDAPQGAMHPTRQTVKPVETEAFWKQVLYANTRFLLRKKRQNGGNEKKEVPRNIPT